MHSYLNSLLTASQTTICFRYRLRYEKRRKWNTLLRLLRQQTILLTKTYYTATTRRQKSSLQVFLRQCCCALNEIREITSEAESLVEQTLAG